MAAPGPSSPRGNSPSPFFAVPLSSLAPKPAAAAANAAPQEHVDVAHSAAGGGDTRAPGAGDAPSAEGAEVPDPSALRAASASPVEVAAETAARPPCALLLPVRAAPGSAVAPQPCPATTRQTVTFAFTSSPMARAPCFTNSVDSWTMEHAMAWEPSTRSYHVDTDLPAKTIVRYCYVIDGQKKIDAGEPRECDSVGNSFNVFITTGEASKVAASVAAARVVEALEEAERCAEREEVIGQLKDAIATWCDSLTSTVQFSLDGLSDKVAVERSDYAAASMSVKVLLSQCATMHGAEPL
jgi:hypothetical protein